MSTRYPLMVESRKVFDDISVMVRLDNDDLLAH